MNQLIDYALQNIWCAPRQDNQSIIKPARLTTPGGVWNQVNVMWRSWTLPQQRQRFHVFQIGYLPPRVVGLFPKAFKWVSFADACNKQRLIVDIYSKSGVQMPRSECWYMHTPEGDLLVAVKHQGKIPFNPGTEDLYIRFYTNAYYQLGLHPELSTLVNVNGVSSTSTQDILNIQHEFEAYKQLPGVTYGFINGLYAPVISLLTAQPGDFVEYVYDSSVYRVVDFAVSSLPSFTSTLDQKRKYLLNYPGNTLQIDYHDDIDFYLLAPTGQGSYYHRNNPDAVRMVTHKDYSIPVDYIVASAASRPELGDPQSLTIRLHIRNSGLQRPLVNENNRIHELYKLPHQQIVNAMLGVDASVPFWNAAVLEASPYTEIMRTDASTLPEATVESALGYNAISRVLYGTPSQVYLESYQKVADLPYGLQTRSMGYEYDAAGKLLLATQHPTGSQYFAGHIQAAWVEVLEGYGSDTLDETYGQQTSSIDPTLDYRFYTCDIINGQAVNNWKDVTGTSAYAIVNNQVTWFVDPAKTYTLVRSNRDFLSYSLSLPVDKGLIVFSLTHRAYRNGNWNSYLMQIPLGELSIWLNGRRLIEGLDYRVDFPEIVIVNKEYLIKPQSQNQDIDIRFTGLADTNMQRTPQGDVGFVRYGMLSRNNRYDIRDDKVTNITVDGYYYDRSELVFSEDHPGVSPTDARNGAPYQISDIVTPLRGLTSQDTYAMRNKSLAIDKVVSDYMTLYDPDEPQTNPDVIPSLYAIFSPFCNKLIMDLASKTLSDPRLQLQYNYDLVKELCAGYEWLLKFDPTQEGLQPDLNFVIVQPHYLTTVVELDIYSYNFLRKAITYYLKDRVNLADFVRIKQGGI